MSDLESTLIKNNADHEIMKNQIKNIGIVNKALLGVLIALFGVMLTVLLSIKNYSKDSYVVRVETLKTTNDIIKLVKYNADAIKKNKTYIIGVDNRVKTIENKQ